MHCYWLPLLGERAGVRGERNRERSQAVTETSPSKPRRGEGRIGKAPRFFLPSPHRGEGGRRPGEGASRWEITSFTLRERGGVGREVSTVATPDPALGSTAGLRSRAPAGDLSRGPADGGGTRRVASAARGPTAGGRGVAPNRRQAPSRDREVIPGPFLRRCRSASSCKIRCRPLPLHMTRSMAPAYSTLNGLLIQRAERLANVA